MISHDLDKGWVKLESQDYFLTEHTKHGGVASLTRAEYERLRPLAALADLRG